MRAKRPGPGHPNEWLREYLDFLVLQQADVRASIRKLDERHDQLAEKLVKLETQVDGMRVVDQRRAAFRAGIVATCVSSLIALVLRLFRI